MSLKDNIGIIIVIGLFILTNIIFFNYNSIFWDSAVYIGMGKYIYSFGKAGLWEPSRPILLPLFLGLIWKIGLNPVLFGKIFSLLSSIGCILLTYLIAKKIFNKNIALISSLFLAFSYTFIFFSIKILSEIPSLFFILLSIYFFINKKFFLTGLFAGIAFLTRFLEIFVFFVIFALFFIYFRKENRFVQKFFRMLIGFLIILTPYLILNYILYKNLFYPFILQLFLTKNTGFMYHQPILFYFASLFRENILFVFAIIGLILIFKKPEYRKLVILSSFLIFFLFFSFISHKETRFMLLFLPYLCIIASYGIFTILKTKNKKLSFYSIILILLIFFSQAVYNIKYNYFVGEDGRYSVFENYLDQSEGIIWLSNPIYSVFSNKKIDELMYYPTFNHDKFLELSSNLNKASNVLINTCDLYCEPYNNLCSIDKNEFIRLLKNNFEIVYYGTEEECESYILRK